LSPPLVQGVFAVPLEAAQPNGDGSQHSGANSSLAGKQRWHFSSKKRLRRSAGFCLKSQSELPTLAGKAQKASVKNSFGASPTLKSEEVTHPFCLGNVLCGGSLKVSY